MRVDHLDDAPPPFRRRSWAETAGTATALTALLFWTGPVIDAAVRGALDARVSRRGVAEFAALCAFLTLLFRTRTVPPRPWGDRDGGAVVVRVSPLRRLAWSGLVFLFALAQLLELRAEGRIDSAGVAGLSGAVAAALAVADRFFGRSVRVTEAGLEPVSPWTGRRRLVPWAAIAAIVDDGIGGSLRFHVADAPAVEVLLVSDGLGELASAALAFAPARAMGAAGGMRALLEAWAAQVARRHGGSAA